MPPTLVAYLDRINYDAPVRPDLPTLIGVHRAHLLNIIYENLDIHRGCPLTVDFDTFYAKIVEERRGGWCFEMNGLLAWALREIGFEVTLLASAVGRTSVDEPFAPNHLILRVDLDQPYLADVGFGNGLLEPIPLAEGRYQQGWLEFGLQRDGDRWWFQNQPYGGPGFDFTLEPYQLSDFAQQSHHLQTSPESGFVRTTVCHRYTPEGIITLRGATLRHVTVEGQRDEVIRDAATYARTLADVFDLHLEDTDALWEKVWTRHQVWSQGS